MLLSIFFKERHAEWAAHQLNLHSRELRTSTVHLTETLIRLEDQQPHLFSKMEEQLLYNGIRFVPPDIVQARIAAKARKRFPLNLGDCFAYALAKQEGCSILTLDKDFRLLDCSILHPY